MELSDLPGGLSIPAKIKQNAILALANGVAGLITAALDIPTAYLDRVSEVARAKTEGKVTVTLAAARAAAKRLEGDRDLAERALDYFGSKIVGEQQNRESVARKFLNRLAESPTDEDTSSDIDEDWLTAFWRLAETKTSDDVQELLARLLTSEVTRPGSVSPTTLQTLSVLTSDLGRAFERLCRLSIDDGDSVYVIHPQVFAFKTMGPLGEFGISYEDLFELDGAGLIRSAETLLLDYAESEDHKAELVDFGGVRASIDLAGKQVHSIQFTRAGKELRRLIALAPVPEYTNALKKRLGDAFVLVDDPGIADGTDGNEPN
ncbi:MAG: DUF2806 domain-containing protein [Acidobacteriota bacterium]